MVSTLKTTQTDLLFYLVLSACRKARAPSFCGGSQNASGSPKRRTKRRTRSTPNPTPGIVTVLEAFGGHRADSRLGAVSPVWAFSEQVREIVILTELDLH